MRQNSIGMLQLGKLRQGKKRFLVQRLRWRRYIGVLMQSWSFRGLYR